MSPYQQLLVITMEECGELIQACSKVLRQNQFAAEYDAPFYSPHNPADNAISKITEEAGDLQCMIELLVEYDICSWTEIEQRVDVKRTKLKRWSDLINDDDE